VEYRRLGKSDLEVSLLGLGAWQLADPEYWGADSDVDCEGTVRAALDAGINFFDTAEGYGDGESERVLEKALGDRRNEAIIASKVLPEHCAPADLKSACEQSLERLDSDYIDLYQIHWPPREVPCADVFGAAEELRAAGKIREIGVSNFGPQDIEDWMHVGGAVSNQLGYNLAARMIEYEIVPACRKHGLGVIAYMPLLQGILAGRWESIEEIPMKRRRFRHFSATREGTRHGEAGHEDFLMDMLSDLRYYAERKGVSMAALCLWWLTVQPGVSSIIVGARKPEQLQRNIDAVDLKLGPVAHADLNELSGPLKEALGRNADLWEGIQHSRIR